MLVQLSLLTMQNLTYSLLQNTLEMTFKSAPRLKSGLQIKRENPPPGQYYDPRGWRIFCHCGVFVLFLHSPSLQQRHDGVIMICLACKCVRGFQFHSYRGLFKTVNSRRGAERWYCEMHAGGRNKPEGRKCFWDQHVEPHCDLNSTDHK